MKFYLFHSYFSLAKLSGVCLKSLMASFDFTDDHELKMISQNKILDIIFLTIW